MHMIVGKSACTRFFYKKKVYKEMRLKSSNLKKIARKSRGSIPKLKCVYWQKSVFVVIAFKLIKMEFKFKIIKDSLHHSRQFISLKVKKNLRKSQAQFREKLRKLRLRQNIKFLIKKRVYFCSMNQISFLV